MITDTDIRSRIDRDYFAVDEQRDASNEDLRFCDVDGAMYDDWYRDQFASRPKFEFNMIAGSVYDFLGEWADNRFDLKYRPDDMKTGDDDADLVNGLFRKDFYRSNDGMDAVDNAVAEAAKGGIAALKMGTEYVDEEDPEDDRQRVTFEPIFSAYNSVVWDANAKRQDKSDARHVTWLKQMTRDAAEEEWGEGVASAFEPNDQSRFNWSNQKHVWVAHHYEIRTEKTEAITFEDPLGRSKTVFRDEVKNVLEELADGGYEQIRSKRVKRRSVWKSILSSSGYLEEPRRIVGKHLPIIPLYAYRGYVDGQEFWYGIVRKYKDANRLFNMAATDVAESASTTSKDMPIFTDEQVEGRETQLREMHLGKFNYAVINPVQDEHGNEQHIGPVGTWAASRVDPNNAAIIQVAQEFISSGVGTTPKEIEKASLSGVAVDKLKQVIDSKTSVIMDGIRKMYARIGEVYTSMAKEIYDTERVEYILQQDGTDRMIRLFDIVVDEETGKPKFINDITDKGFAVKVDTGPAYQSRRRETQEGLREVAEFATDEYKPFLLASMIENMDGVGLEDLREFNRMNMIRLGLKKPETDEEKQMAAMAQDQNQNAQQQLMMSMAKKEEAEAQELLSEVQKNATQARLNQAKAMSEMNGIQMGRLTGGQKAVEQGVQRATESTQPPPDDLERLEKMVSIEATRAKAKKDNADADAQIIENELVKSGVNDFLERAANAGP